MCEDVFLYKTGDNKEKLKDSLVLKGYEDLFQVFVLALEQAQGGKGAERHASGLPFNNQPMQKIQSLVGEGFALGQAIKKCQEAFRFEDIERKEREYLGAINYIAGAIIYNRKNGSNHATK